MARILYIDVAQPGTEELLRLFESRGHAVSHVACAERAMMLMARGHEYQALVLGLYLPGMDGAEFCRWVDRCGQGKQIPTVAFTWRGQKLPQGLRAGWGSFLPASKFINGLESCGQLVEAVEELLGAHGGAAEGEC